MTPEERRRRGKRLSEKLKTEVLSLLTCDTLQQNLHALDADFMAALMAWEATGAEKDRLRVRDAYIAITEAWKAITPPARPTHESARDIAPRR